MKNEFMSVAEQIKRDRQIERIEKYESIMNEAFELLENGDNDERLSALIKELDDYYQSQQWKQDFADDEAGLLPLDLKRGVLSEDGIYDLLERIKDYI